MRPPRGPLPADSNVPAASTVRIGTRVEVKFDGAWYAGSVVGLPSRAAKGFHVTFDDGDSANDVRLNEMRLVAAAHVVDVTDARRASARGLARLATMPPVAAKPAAEAAGAADRGAAAVLAAAKKSGRWADGAPLGRGHGQPYLQPKYAELMRQGAKTVEGRANVGWAAAVAAGDWVTFKISGSNGKKLVVRVVRVERFATFREMLRACGLEKCLPGCASEAEGIETYHAFGTMDGRTYKELEADHGVVGVHVVPL